MDDATLRAFRSARKQRRGRRKHAVHQIEGAISTIDDTWLTEAAVAVCFIYFGIGVVSVLLEGLSVTPLALRMVGCIGLTVALEVPHFVATRWRVSRFWSDMPPGARDRIKQLSRIPSKQWTGELAAEIEQFEETARQVAKRHEEGCLVVWYSLLVLSTPLWVWWVSGAVVDSLL